MAWLVYTVCGVSNCGLNKKTANLLPLILNRSLKYNGMVWSKMVGSQSLINA
jgi:hypothetical protein